MCGIVGYAGKRQAVPVLLDGLERLEYRGYDSAGICVAGERTLQLCKAKGKLENLRQKLQNGAAVFGTCGIGHTRWATHGAPSDVNSHPHLSASGEIGLVHNGIIENERVLRKELEKTGIVFRSETDTEVIANLIDWYYGKQGDFLQAVRSALTRLEGSFALGILCREHPGTVVAAKKDSPLVFGFGEEENFIASDVAAILKYTRNIACLDDGELAVFTGESVRFYNREGEPIEKERQQIRWEQTAVDRGDFAHFMSKEIMEQPKAIRDTINPRLRNGNIYLEGICLEKQFLQKCRKIYLVACGSAYYSAVLGKYSIEQTCRIPAEAIMASEFRYGHPVIGKNDLVILISQSGETADTLAALKEAKRLGAYTLAIVNVVGSAVATLADQVLYTWAGPEIAVATTKAFSAQLAVLYLLTGYMAKQLETISEEAQQSLVKALVQLPEQVQQVLSRENMEKCKAYAKRYHNNRDAFYIGRNVDYAMCLEGSLKLKEVAYLHSEAYPAGELKHGPICMIEQGTLVVALATVEPLVEKTAANIREVLARGGNVLCVTVEGMEERISGVTDFIAVPQIHPLLQPSLSVLPLQLFAYYVAVFRGCDVDKPRNLAKSVTVE